MQKLEKILENEPKYRLKQAEGAVFKNFISDWSEATFFSKDLREKLNNDCPLSIEADVLVSRPSGRGSPSEAAKNPAIKAKIMLEDGLEIESVLMRHKDGRNTVCVSCQVGCPMNCEFCATGKMGFKRDLNHFEILEQVIFFSRYLKKITSSSLSIRAEGPSESEGSASRVSNVTFMGMGEPFLNYDNVMKAIRMLNNKDYFNISARSISVSTSGIIGGIKKLIDESLSREAGSRVAGQLNMAISLHAPNDELRSSLMPVNKTHNLKELFSAIDEYIKKTKRKVMFEYVLIKDINDSDECAKQLAKLMAKKLYFLNLILYNPTGPFYPSSTKRVEAFKKILRKNLPAGRQVNFVQRYRFGDDIKAACGQFATGNTKR